MQRNFPKKILSSKNRDFLLAEYAALREEIIKRVEIEYQTLAFALTAFAGGK